jgi:hypothetical protein
MPTRKGARRRKKRSLDSERYTSAEFKPYVAAIGQIALAWNDLHETLCSLFATLTGVLVDDGMLEAAWQSLPSDRAKRGMLKAAIQQMSYDAKKHNPLAQNEMKWFFGQLDRLEEDRNNAIHAPLSTFSHPSWQLLAKALDLPVVRHPGVQPDDVRSNRRAANLKNKRLLDEYRCVRDEIIAFREYAEEVESSWNWTEKGNDTWPQRPILPKRGDR